jgi:hypothetical protein
MSDPLVSEATFRWILTVLTLAGCSWALYDVVRLVRLPRASTRDRKRADKRLRVLDRDRRRDCSGSPAC